MTVHTYTFTGDLALTPRVRERIAQVHDHIAEMRRERQGWGDLAAREVADTALSFMDALRVLNEATEVWIDGGAGLSFGGILPGGIVFGVIAREKPSMGGDDMLPVIEWTFHS
jgi:hypothetical protein